MSRTVIVLAHWSFNSSRINKALINQVKTDLPDVLIRDLYSLYGDTKFNQHINAEEDQKILESAEKIILQFPFFWYSPPALLSQWLDDVLTYGWAYNTKEPKLKNKKLCIAVTTGGAKEAYAPSGFNAHFLEEFLNNITQTAKFCEMKFSGIFATQNAMKITDEELSKQVKDYIKFITEK